MSKLLFTTIFLFISSINLLASANTDAKIVQGANKAVNPPNIMVSIKPLQLIVAAITGNNTDINVLLPPNSSPHDYQLKPSDIDKLHSAKLFIWVGNGMENFLTKIVKKIDYKTNVISMLDLQDIKKLPYKRLLKDNHHHTTTCKHQHGLIDTHVWLNIDNTALLANAVVAELITLDKKNAALYKKNLEIFIAELTNFKHRSSAKLTAISTAEIFVFHDAYGYLEDQYKFNIIDYFTIDTTKKPGAKHLHTIRTKLKNSKHPCLLLEPQFDETIFSNLASSNKNICVSYIDPLATKIPVIQQGYILFLESLVESLQKCIVK